VNEKIIGDHVDHAARAAKLTHRGIHILRHSFCSHLAMRGAPARAIQELAGHADLRTTQRYMHLGPAALESAIRLLEHSGRGDISNDVGNVKGPFSVQAAGVGSHKPRVGGGGRV
jgi:hypothetical protein